MSDVLQTAVKYRNRLKSELAKIEEFLRMADELSKDRDPETRLALAKVSAHAATAEPAAGGRVPANGANAG